MARVCYGARGEPAVAQSSKTSVDALVAFIEHPAGATPKLHPAPLDDAEATAVATYVMTPQAKPEMSR